MTGVRIWRSSKWGGLVSIPFMEEAKRSLFNLREASRVVAFTFRNFLSGFHSPPSSLMF